jgi:hypothetical protein
VATIPLIRVAGKDAPAEIERLRAEWATTGLYPILFGDDRDWESIEASLEDTEALSAMLERSRAINPTRWFRERPEGDPELYATEVGKWPESGAEPMGLVTHLDMLTDRPKPEVTIGLLKLAAPWEAFAHLRWGGWNDCPLAEEHCAIHRHWSERYGAEIVSISGDTVQCSVARPPMDRPASLDLAREQYIYCYDIVVDQGTQTIAALAASLLAAEYWFFWWD